jgi:hypothetical protein
MRKRCCGWIKRSSDQLKINLYFFEQNKLYSIKKHLLRYSRYKRGLNMHNRPKIIVVGLNISDLEYAALSTPEKIICLRNAIRDTCKKLQKDEPNAAWFIGWRENGVFQSIEEYFVLNGLLKPFKQTFLDLTQEYAPNLTIVAGTLKIKKTIRNVSALAKQKRSYKSHRWISFWEQQNSLKGKSEAHPLEAHRNLLFEPTIAHSSVVDVLSSRCYVSNGSTYKRLDKTAPISELHYPHFPPSPHETKDPISKIKKYNPLIFQPAHKKFANPIMKVLHPDGSTIKFVIEICRDHALGLAKKALTDTPPHIHFLISASIMALPNNMAGKELIHFDSLVGTQHQISESKEDNEYDIRVYTMNPLDKSLRLEEVKRTPFPPPLSSTEENEEPLSTAEDPPFLKGCEAIRKAISKPPTSEDHSVLPREIRKIVVSQFKNILSAIASDFRKISGRS